MKSEITTRKAEGLGNAQSESSNPKSQNPTKQMQDGGAAARSDLLTLTAPTQRELQSFDEQHFLAGLRDYMRSAKRSPVLGIANAARSWEPEINFRILVGLQRRERREAARAKRLGLRVRVAVKTDSTRQPENGAESKGVCAAPHPSGGNPHPTLRATLSHPMSEGPLPRAEKALYPIEAEREKAARVGSTLHPGNGAQGLRRPALKNGDAVERVPTLSATASPSALRIQAGVFPKPG